MLKLGRYQHYKGNFYEVMGEVTHSESEEKLVLYKPLYGEMNLWVRPLDMFVEELEFKGLHVKRFAYVGEGLE